jgi:hypothetical protein
VLKVPHRQVKAAKQNTPRAELITKDLEPRRVFSKKIDPTWEV